MYALHDSVCKNIQEHCKTLSVLNKLGFFGLTTNFIYLRFLLQGMRRDVVSIIAYYM